MSTLTKEATTPVADRGTAGEGESFIDRESHFNGLYETRQNLRIEGLAEGEIECQGTLFVAEGARVKAKVTASRITIAGQLDGEVTCRGVFQILPTGQVQASVSAHRLIVQEGGLYNGEFHMISDEAAVATTTASSGGEKARPAEDAEPEVGSDEWWKQFNREAVAASGDDGAEMPEEPSS